MDWNSIRSTLHEQPFKPFDLYLADERRASVKQPEFVVMNQPIVIVTDEESVTKIHEALLIVSLERKPGKGKSGNGSSRHPSVSLNCE